MRVDTLSQVLSLANIRGGGRVLVYEDLGGLILGAIAERDCFPVSIHKKTGIIQQLAFKYNKPTESFFFVSFSELDSCGLLPNPLKPFILTNNSNPISKDFDQDISEEFGDSNIQVPIISNYQVPIEAEGLIQPFKVRKFAPERHEKREQKSSKIVELFGGLHEESKKFESLILAISPYDFSSNDFIEFYKLIISNLCSFIEPSGSVVIYSQFKEVYFMV